MARELTLFCTEIRLTCFFDSTGTTGDAPITSPKNKGKSKAQVTDEPMNEEVGNDEEEEGEEDDDDDIEDDEEEEEEEEVS